MKPAVGSEVEYRAFAGDRWRAEVRAVYPCGRFVDLAVIVPGCEERVALSAVRWGEDGRAGWPEAQR